MTEADLQAYNLSKSQHNCDSIFDFLTVETREFYILKLDFNKTGNAHINLTLRRLRVTTVAVEKQ